MKYINLFSIIAVMAICSSCKFVTVNSEKINGIVESEVIEGTDSLSISTHVGMIFNSLQTNLACDIDFTQGETSVVTVKAPENIINHIVLDIADNTLIIKKDDDVKFRNAKIIVEVQNPDLKLLNINGAADFTALTPIKTDEMNIIVNGAAEINVDQLKADKLSLNINGAADASIKGIECETLDVNINGAAESILEGNATDAKISINGAGELDIRQMTIKHFTKTVRGVGSIKQ